jgi:lipopolysaccharide export LptBFGC system permease protein LptF
VATLVIILFGAPLANSPPRRPAYGIGISLGITIFYMMLFKLTGAMGVSGMMDPMVAAWGEARTAKSPAQPSRPGSDTAS